MPRRIPTLADLPHADPIGCCCDECWDWLLRTDDQTIAPYRRAVSLIRHSLALGLISEAEANAEYERMAAHERMVANEAQRRGWYGSVDPRELQVDFAAALDRIAERCEVSDDPPQPAPVHSARGFPAGTVVPSMV